MMKFHCTPYQLDFATPKVMGIVNVTPDSFSDGGQYQTAAQAITQALKLVEQGADILDIGGESTRPNATPVPLQEELDRVMPVIEALSGKVAVPISIDTYKPEVMQAAISAGASIVNDVYALQMPGAVDVLARNPNIGICLMHMQGTPQNMQSNPTYQDVVREVIDFLHTRLQQLKLAGIDQKRILLDPGFGFGKRTVHNLTLLNHLNQLTSLGCPLLVGLSRKSVLGQVLSTENSDRLHASIAAAVIAAMKGAAIIRVHDVKATVDALKVVSAVHQQGSASTL